MAWHHVNQLGLVNHLKWYGQRHKQVVYEETLSGHPTKPTCPTCRLVCKSAGDLIRHSKIHKIFLSR